VVDFVVLPRKKACARHGVYKEIGSPDDKDMYVKALWMSFIPKKTVAERLKNLVNDFILTGEEAANMYGIGDYYTSEYEFYHNKRKPYRLYPVEDQISDKICAIHETHNGSQNAIHQYIC
jgi:hypothetical protein